MNDLIFEHLDIWTSAPVRKANSGRGAQHSALEEITGSAGRQGAV